MPDAEWTIAALGLGGNIGDPQAAMAQALREIDADADCRIKAVSDVYRTPPWGKTDQADFYNACALVETRLDAEALLARCLEVELGMKRVRLERWGPRTIDIDVLTYGDSEKRNERLEVPHPRMTERAFVLVPLADIAGDMMIKGRAVSVWLTDLDTAGITRANKNPHWWRV
jgi:2-amino-4-hydroxy-6-hydroxymethyldihydropteridine diphosphokinase